jgi:hypothetical protein
VLAEESDALRLTDLRAAHIHGGDGANNISVQGVGVGVELAGGGLPIVERLLVHDVDGSAAYGLGLSGQTIVRVRRATIAALTSSAEPEEDDSAGIHVGAGITATIEDSIVTETARWGVLNHADNLPEDARLTGLLVWLPDAEGDVLEVAPALREQPIFFNPLVDDYRLRANSPGVDGGTLDCDGEPVCEEKPCLSDLGYFAGTDDAEALCGD